MNEEKMEIKLIILLRIDFLVHFYDECTKEWRDVRISKTVVGSPASTDNVIDTYERTFEDVHYDTELIPQLD